MSHPRVVQLGRPEVAGDSERLLALLLTLREEVEGGGLSASELASPLVRLVASNNAAVKAEVCHLLILAAAGEPDLGLLVVNTLNKDLCDPNPAVRSTAVTAICSLPVLLPHATAAIEAALSDSNPSVRVAGVTGVGRLWRHSPSDCHQLGHVNRLYATLRDPEPSVVTFSIQTLNTVLAEEGGIVINGNMVKYFLSRLGDYRERELCFLLDCLAVPGLDSALQLRMLNTLDPLLERREGTVVLAVARLLTRVVMDQPSLRASLVLRLTPILTAFLRTGHRDFSVLLIDFLSSLGEDYIEQMKPSLSVLYVKAKDSEKLKSRKITFLQRLVDEDNAMEIVNYLFNLLPQSSNLTGVIFQSIATISQEEPSCYGHCITNLQLLVRADSDRYLMDILAITETLGLENDTTVDVTKRSEFVAAILDNMTAEQLTTDSVTSVLQLLQDFGPQLPEAPYYFEAVLESRQVTKTHSPFPSTSSHILLLLLTGDMEPGDPLPAPHLLRVPPAGPAARHAAHRSGTFTLLLHLIHQLLLLLLLLLFLLHPR
jgi:hypothetical protein